MPQQRRFDIVGGDGRRFHGNRVGIDCYRNDAGRLPTDSSCQHRLVSSVSLSVSLARIAGVKGTEPPSPRHTVAASQLLPRLPGRLWRRCPGASPRQQRAQFVALVRPETIRCRMSVR